MSRARALVLAPAILFGCLLAAAPALAGPPPPAGWTDGYVSANGIRLHYWRTGGAKPALVLAHGSSDDALCWTNLARELTDRYDVIMFDARGHGLSDPPTAADPVDVQVEDLAGLIKALQARQADPHGPLDGQRLGGVVRGQVSRRAARGHPGGPGAGAAGHAGGAGRARRALRRRAARHTSSSATTLSEAELVADCMKNSPKWGQAECETWAPSKRRHHPDTVARQQRAASADARAAAEDRRADADPEGRRAGRSARAERGGRQAPAEGTPRPHHRRRPQRPARARATRRRRLGSAA